MEWKIPFFDYDLFARISPGALTIAVAQYVGMPMPQYWKPLLPMSAAEGATLDTGIVLFGGLTLLGASYVIGLIYESLCSGFWKSMCRGALKRAAKKRTNWRQRVVDAPTGPKLNEADLFMILQQWLLSSKEEDVRGVYAHIQRFQAEARLCAYSVFPLAALSVAVFFNKGNAWIAWGSLVMAIIFVPCACFREQRRWIQAIATLDELRHNDDLTLAMLQWQLQNLK